MTLHPPLWAGSGTYTDDADRQFVTNLFPAEGVLDLSAAFKVSQKAAGANMSVDIAVGGAIVQGDHVAGQGRYMCANDAVENRAVTAAPGVGNSRIDRIVLVAHDAEAVGSGTTATRIDYIAGTPGASPSPPAVPSSALPLARITVPSGKLSIVDGDITDDRVPAQVMNRSPVVAEFGATSQSVANGTEADKTLSVPTIRPATYATSLFFSAGTPTRMLIPWTGVYSVSFTPKISANAGFGWYLQLFKDADSGTSYLGALDVHFFTGSAPVAQTLALTGLYLTAGQYLRWRVGNITGNTRTFSAATNGFPRLHYHGAA
jgi:hypothetical protein